MEISKEDIGTLKSLADNVDVDITNIASNRASTYLSIETISHIRKSTRNNILFIALGALIGITPSLIQGIAEENNVEVELKELRKEILDIKLQINHYQMSSSKKDSL